MATQITLVNGPQGLPHSGKDPLSAFIVKNSSISPIADNEISVPVIDLSILSSQSLSIDREAEMEKLRFALTSWGMFQVIGHGISSTLLDEMCRLGKEFFHLPLEEKKKVYIPKNDGIDGMKYPQGYSGDHFSEDNVLDWTERLFFALKPSEQRQQKLWPKSPNNFKEVFEEYTTKAMTVTETLFKLMAEVLCLQENYFLDMYDFRANENARLNYFPPCPRPDLVFGLKAHTDRGALTLLLPDQKVDGLQIFKDGQWFKVPIVPYALDVNICDLLEIKTNGVFKSPKHRVVTSSQYERFSLAIFYNPHLDQEVEPAVELINETRPKSYRKVVVKEYHKLSYAHYLQGNEPANLAKN